MPRKTTKAADAANRVLPRIPEELLEHFGDEPMTAEAVQAASIAFKKALIERALKGELNHHLRSAAAPAPKVPKGATPSRTVTFAMAGVPRRF